MKTVPELDRRISPFDLIFGLWVDDPVCRGNIKRYLFTRFRPETVLEAAIKHIRETGKRASSPAVCGTADETGNIEQGPRITAERLIGSDLPSKEKERLFSVFARTLTRFQLIKTLPHIPVKIVGRDGGASHDSQMRFEFVQAREKDSMNPEFRSRIWALRDVHDGGQ